jgi:hypothetical protein
MRWIISAAIAGIALLLAAGMAQAQDTTYITQDTTIDGTIGSGGVVIGFADQFAQIFKSNPTSPTVTIIDGAYVIGSVAAFNGSVVNMEGGSVGALGANDNSQVAISAGQMDQILADDNGTMTMSGGSTYFGFTLSDNSTFTMTDGLIGQEELITPGSTSGDSNLSGNASAILNGGTIGNNTTLNQSSTLFANNIMGYGNFTLNDTSQVTLSSGTALGLNAYGNSTAMINSATLSGEVFSGGSSDSVIVNTSTIGLAFCHGGTLIINQTQNMGVADTDGGTLTVNGGQIAGEASADDFYPNSTGPDLTLKGGVVVNGLVQASLAGTVEIDIAQINGGIQTNQNGTVIDNGDTIATPLDTYDTSLFVMNGGQYTGQMTTHDGSFIQINSGTASSVTAAGYGSTNSPNSGVQIYGGTVTTLNAQETGLATLYDGTVQTANVSSSGHLNLAGGQVLGTTNVTDSGVVNMYGSTIGPVASLRPIQTLSPCVDNTS